MSCPLRRWAGLGAVLSPLGYSRTGAYGKTDKPDATADTPRIARLSELDVMNVLALVRAEYHIDDNRIYLTGGSMGGGGTWRLASKYPHIWAAVGPIAAAITPREIDIDGMKHIPVFVSHGGADQTVPVESSRVMVSLMKKLGMTYEYLEIPGGPHDVSATALPKAVEFFNRHKRKPAPDD